MATTRRDSLKRRLPSPPAVDAPASVPGIAPALVEHLLDLFGEGMGFSQLVPGAGYSISEAALSASAAQAGRDEILNYLVHLSESQR